ncbi:MAG: hypothetical protein DRI90_10545 [Deltaproteobacteria bacterium]|nr:MAG: hypothetical protein DRI90_10545 [Deltaproteobacteria bacterium]
MRKGLIIAGVVCLAALLVLIVVRRQPAGGDLAAGPELATVAPTEATIVWRARKSSQGRINYQRSGVEGEPQSAQEMRPPSKRHEVVIEGLEPATRYDYWLGDGSHRYHFETESLPTTPFSFLLVWGDVSAKLEGLVQSETPAFVLSLTPLVAKEPDPLRSARPFLPVFGPGGATSTLLEQPETPTWTLDWGGLRLIMLGEESKLEPLLDAPAAHTLGVVVRAQSLDQATIASSSLHAKLVAHNQQVPARPVAFVLVPGQAGTEVEVDGLRYLGLPVDEPTQASQGALRFDVGPEATVAHFLEQKREVALREPKIGKRRTCTECRQLADRGAYEESVKAYQQFIADNAGHYQIDDAHYAIAELLDERLFRFGEALTWYQKLSDQYPSSTLVPLARQRIKFLQAHSDHDYQPLARFERIRKVDYARQKNDVAGQEKMLNQVRGIITEFPSCSLAPEMVYWLANQYRSMDPDRAVATYRELIQNHPESLNVVDGRIEIGETFYLAGRYADAIAAFTEARAKIPGRAEAIDAMMGRAHRNVARGRLAWGGWLLILLIIIPGVAGPPVGLPRRELRQAAIAFVPLCAVILIVGWLIHEQFTSSRELLGLSFAIAAAGAFGFPFTVRLSQKVVPCQPEQAGKGRQVLRAAFGMLLGLLLLGAGAYLAVFHINAHYLTSFGI